MACKEQKRHVRRYLLNTCYVISCILICVILCMAEFIFIQQMNCNCTYKFTKQCSIIFILITVGISQFYIRLVLELYRLPTDRDNNSNFELKLTCTVKDSESPSSPDVSKKVRDEVVQCIQSVGQNLALKCRVKFLAQPVFILLETLIKWNRYPERPAFLLSSQCTHFK